MEIAVKREAAAGRGSAVPTPAAEKRSEDVPALTGLRFVAAFSVLVGHSLTTLMSNHETPLGAIYWIKQSSGFGMTLFFVLSGFVIHYNYATLVTEGGRRGVAAFLWARFARLYPLFLLMMLVYVLVSSRTFDLVTGHPERFGSLLRALPFFLLSIHSWLYLSIDGNSLVSAIGGGSPLTWSISTEWFFYFAYPFIAFLVLRARRPWLAAGLAVLWCALWMSFAAGLSDRTPAIDAWAVSHYGPIVGVTDHEQDSFVRWLLYFSPYLRIGEFVLGAFTAQLYVQLQSRKISWWENALGAVVFVAAAVSVILVTYLEYDPNIGVNIFRRLNYNFALAPSAALLMFTAARYRNIATRMLTSRAAIVLGEASYSIYLVHDVILLATIRLTGAAVHGFIYDFVKLLLVMAVILLISIMLYKYYEAPARRWLRQLWDRRQGVAVLTKASQSLTI
jgi:peptidoglycan/LPS O-acetylase OafA/YrhL